MIFDIGLENIILGMVPWAIAGIIAVMLALRPYGRSLAMMVLVFRSPMADEYSNNRRIELYVYVYENVGA